MSYDSIRKKAWERPRLRSERVHQTLAKPACQFKPPGPGASNPKRTREKKGSGGWGPAFS